MVRRTAITGGFMLVYSWALPLVAQQRDPAAAQALFDQGRALMKAQNYTEACPKLAESQRLDPGIGTQFHLADCYERQGKIASAWANFLDVASLAAAANQPEREKAARGRAAKLEPRLPRLTIVVPPETRTPGLAITRDGSSVGESQWGTPVPVDPGDHQLSASAPGRKTYSDTVSLKEGLSRTLKIPMLEASSEQAAVPGPASTTTPAAPEAPPAQPQPIMPPPAAPAPPSSESSGGPGPLVIGLGIVGVAGLGAGTVLGLMASSKFEDSKKQCNPADENRCDAEGVSLRDDAFTLGNWSTVSFIVGGVALAGAGVIWLTSGSSDSKTGNRGALQAGVQMSPARGSVLIKGSF